MKQQTSLAIERQRGASAILILIFLMMAAVCLLVGFKLYGPFFEHWKVSSVVDSFDEESELAEQSLNEIKKNFETRLRTNNIQKFDLDESTEFYKEDGEFAIYVDYEVRVNVYRNIDAVIRFEKTLEKKL